MQQHMKRILWTNMSDYFKFGTSMGVTNREGEDWVKIWRFLLLVSIRVYYWETYWDPQMIHSHASGITA
jgi:hypothetical protein